MSKVPHHCSCSYGVQQLIALVVESSSDTVEKMATGALRWAAGGWVLFVAENALLSENRTYLIEVLGDDGYHAAYGLCSTAATASIAFAYRYRLPPVPNQAVSNLRYGISWLLTSSGLFLASQTAPSLQVPLAFDGGTQADAQVASNVASASQKSWNLKVRCPFDFSSSSEFGPAERLTRHPGLWSMALVGAGAAVRQSSTARAIWWLGPSLVATVGGAHTDSRYRRGMGGSLPPEKDSVTSNVPGAALLTGRQGHRAFSKLVADIKPLNAVAALAVAAIVTLASRGRVRV